MEEKVEVYIKELGKKKYRLVIEDGTYLGGIVDGFVEYLEFTNEFSAMTYLEHDDRLILKDVIHKN